MSSAPTTPQQLKDIAKKFLDLLIAKKDFEALTPLLHEKLAFQHDDMPPTESREQYFGMFKSIVLENMPNFDYQLKDIIAEVDPSGKGGKVWFFGLLTGLPGGEVKESADMMAIDANGLITSNKDVQRTVNTGK